jgi:hypothetical protein
MTRALLRAVCWVTLGLLAGLLMSVPWWTVWGLR